MLAGRRHQIRVHCDFIGHRIVGDFTYSNRRDILPFRMMLHSYRIIIPTDIGEDVDVTATDPFSEDDKRCKWSAEQFVSGTEKAIELLDKKCHTLEMNMVSEPKTEKQSLGKRKSRQVHKVLLPR